MLTVCRGHETTKRHRYHFFVFCVDCLTLNERSVRDFRSFHCLGETLPKIKKNFHIVCSYHITAGIEMVCFIIVFAFCKAFRSEITTACHEYWLWYRWEANCSLILKRTLILEIPFNQIWKIVRESWLSDTELETVSLLKYTVFCLRRCKAQTIFPNNFKNYF